MKQYKIQFILGFLLISTLSNPAFASSKMKKTARVSWQLAKIVAGAWVTQHSLSRIDFTKEPSIRTKISHNRLRIAYGLTGIFTLFNSIEELLNERNKKKTLAERFKDQIEKTKKALNLS